MACLLFSVLSKKKMKRTLSKPLSLFFPFSHAPFNRYFAAFISATPVSASALEAENFRTARAPRSEGKGSQANKRGGGSCDEDEEEEERTRARDRVHKRATSNAAAEEAARTIPLLPLPFRRKLEESAAATTQEPARETAAKASRTRDKEEEEEPEKSRSANDSPRATRCEKKRLNAARTRAKERDWTRACRLEDASSAAISSSCCSSVRRGGEEEAGEEACFR